MAIKTNYGSVTDWLSNKKYTPLVTPDDIKNSRTAELQGLGVGDLYGIEYDAGAIEGIYNRATDAQYALKQKEYQAAENQYYRNMYASQNSAIDALRAQRADQIATGMSAGFLTLNSINNDWGHITNSSDNIKLEAKMIFNERLTI